jgi:hypothetical protein
MLKFAAEFGLTASALARVSAIEQTPENDEDAAILFG